MKQRSVFELLTPKPGSAFGDGKRVKPTKTTSSTTASAVKESPEELFSLSFNDETNEWIWIWEQIKPTEEDETEEEMPTKQTCVNCLNSVIDVDCFKVPELPQINDFQIKESETVMSLLLNSHQKSQMATSSSTAPPLYSSQSQSQKKPPQVIVIPLHSHSTASQNMSVSTSNTTQASVSKATSNEFKEWTNQINVKCMTKKEKTMDSSSSKVVNLRTKMKSNLFSSHITWPTTSQQRTYHLSPSLAKSLLQKSVRRCQPNSAIHIAQYLIKEFGFIEFIRRLPIIIVEDAIVHPMLPAIIWMLLASSSKQTENSQQFNPTSYHIDLCLKVVWDIASVKIRDIIPSVASEQGPPSESLVNSLKPTGFAIVNSLLTRAAFGGMKCDIAFLRGMAHIWARRFAIDESGWMNLLCNLYNSSDDNKLHCPKHSEIGAIEKQHLILAAMDFHCSNILEQILSNPRIQNAAAERGQLLVDDSKEAVWFFRSSTNYKMLLPIDGKILELQQSHLNREEQRKRELQPLWSILKEVIDDYSFRLFNEKFW